MIDNASLHRQFRDLMTPSIPTYNPGAWAVVLQNAGAAPALLVPGRTRLPAQSPVAADAGRVRRMTPYTGPLPACLYASPGLNGSCNPIRCWANRGTTCGGSHATLDHCQRCLYPERTP